MINVEGYRAAIEQALVLHSGDLMKCEVAAIEISELCKQFGWSPHFGGKYEDHLKGKIGELGFWKHANQVGDIGPEYDPFPANGYGKFSLKHDFSFVLPDRRLVTVEVKTGWVADQADAMRVDPNGFGMMVPQEQVRDGKELCDIFVYNIAWQTAGREYRVATVGWCNGFTVMSGRLRTDVPHPCYQVPASLLRPMVDFYNFIKTGCLEDTKTESCNIVVEKVACH
jgi:hypothetical protein